MIGFPISELPLLPDAGGYGEDEGSAAAVADLPLRFDRDVMDFVGMGHLSRPLDSDLVSYL